MDTEIIEKEKDEFVLLQIRGGFSIYEVAKLRDNFVRCFETYEGLILDLKDVEECDTAGIQLLCSARITAAKEGKRFVIENPSSAVENAVAAAGLNHEEILGMEA